MLGWLVLLWGFFVLLFFFLNYVWLEKIDFVCLEGGLAGGWRLLKCAGLERGKELGFWLLFWSLLFLLFGF